MPLEPPDQQHLQAADGFIELGMFEEANSKLEEIDPFLRSVFEVLTRRLAIYHGLRKWELMQAASPALPLRIPENPYNKRLKRELLRTLVRARISAT